MFFVISVSAIPVTCRWTLMPSTYYHRLISWLPFKSAKEIPFQDVVLIRSTVGVQHLQNLKVGILDSESNDIIELRQKGLLGVMIRSVNPSAPARMFLGSADTGEVSDVPAVEPRYWGGWRETQQTGVEIKWHGSSPPPRWFQ